MKKILMGAAALALIVAVAPSAMAGSYSFTGSFGQDDNVQLFNFSVGAPSNVTLRTWSYAGGTNAAGQVIPRGGFDPILAVFDSTGQRIGQNDDGGWLVPADAVTGAHFDTYLDVALNPGEYVVSVMQFDNFSLGLELADGFFRAGQPNFTQEWSGGQPGFFYDYTGDHRDGHWAFDILNVEQASAVPLPSAVMFAPLGLALIGLLRRRH